MNTATPSLRIGPTTAPDRYRLVESRSRGGEGAVWAATAPTGDRVAVKVLDPTKVADIEVWDHRWSRGLALTMPHRPGVINVLDVFRGPTPHPPGESSPDTLALYQVMDFVAGDTLREWIDGTPAPSTPARVAVVAELARVVAGLHRGPEPVLHRDVKPDNVMLGPDGPLLIDLGFARRASTDHSMTAMGSMPYLVPEVLSGAGYTTASDRYALGVTAFVVLTGDAFPVGRPAEARRRLDAALDGSAASELRDHVLAMCDVDPAARPADLAGWAANLEEFGPTRSDTTVLQVQPFRPKHKAERRRPVGVLHAVATLAMLAAIGVAGLAGLAGAGSDTPVAVDDQPMTEPTVTEGSVEAAPVLPGEAEDATPAATGQEAFPAADDVPPAPADDPPPPQNDGDGGNRDGGGNDGDGGNRDGGGNEGDGGNRGDGGPRGGG